MTREISFKQKGWLRTCLVAGLLVASVIDCPMASAAEDTLLTILKLTPDISSTDADRPAVGELVEVRVAIEDEAGIRIPNQEVVFELVEGYGNFEVQEETSFLAQTTDVTGVAGIQVRLRSDERLRVSIFLTNDTTNSMEWSVIPATFEYGQIDGVLIGQESYGNTVEYLRNKIVNSSNAIGAAIDNAATLGDPRLLPALTGSLLAEEDTSLRIRAALALALFSAPVHPRMVPEYLRRSAFVETGVPALLLATDDPDTNVRIEVCLTLFNGGDKVIALQQLESLARDGVARAIDGFYAFGLSDHVPRRVLVEKAYPTEAANMARNALNFSDSFVNAVASDFLAHSGERNLAFDKAKQILDESSNVPALLRSLDVFTFLGDARSITELQRATTHENESVRARAIRLLASL